MYSISAFTLLVWHHEGHQACKKFVLAIQITKVFLVDPTLGVLHVNVEQEG